LFRIATDVTQLSQWKLSKLPILALMQSRLILASHEVPEMVKRSPNLIPSHLEMVGIASLLGAAATLDIT
jgi:hypothetical protein